MAMWTSKPDRASNCVHDGQGLPLDEEKHQELGRLWERMKPRREEWAATRRRAAPARRFPTGSGRAARSAEVSHADSGSGFDPDPAEDSEAACYFVGGSHKC